MHSLDMVRKALLGEAGRRSEVNTSKRLGAQLTPASGSMQGVKGDMLLKDYLIEAKSTVANSFSVTLKHLSKIAAEARAIGKTPVMVVTYTMQSGNPVKNGKWVLIPEAEFLALIEK